MAVAREEKWQLKCPTLWTSTSTSRVASKPFLCELLTACHLLAKYLILVCLSLDLLVATQFPRVYLWFISWDRLDSIILSVTQICLDSNACFLLLAQLPITQLPTVFNSQSDRIACALDLNTQLSRT